MKNETPQLREQKVWQGRHRGVPFKIINWSFGEEFDRDMDRPTGNWNFYVFIREDMATDFKSLWLPDEVYRWKPDAAGRITHEYMVEPFNSMELHGGITYYAKRGYTDGYRVVEVGCDYGHLWDRGQHYNSQSVLFDVCACIDKLITDGIVKEKP